MNENTSDYREQLQAELKRRRIKNPSYSLRAFAKFLGFSPAFTSKVLGGKKELSLDSATSVATKLGYNAEELRQFCRLVQYKKLQTPGAKEALLDTAESFQPVGLETFQIISDWYHYAILELAGCDGKALDAQLISTRLGISKPEAVSAMNRLVRTGLLKNVRGRWVKSTEKIATPSETPSRALRNFHSQMIQKAQASLETQPVQIRDITGITLPISVDKIEIAKKEIRNFRRRLAKLLDSSRPTEVYQLNVQFFSLTPPKSQAKDPEEK